MFLASSSDAAMQAMSAARPCTTAWEEVGLSALRQGLDDQAIAIAENQESSLQSRKALAAQAKSFRVSLEEELEASSEVRASSGVLVRDRAFRPMVSSLLAAFRDAIPWWRERSGIPFREAAEDEDRRSTSQVLGLRETWRWYSSGRCLGLIVREVRARVI